MTEPRTADTLTTNELAEIGLQDPARARRLLIGLAGRGVTDDDVAALLPQLLSALAQSPDPDRALTNFVRWTDGIGNPYTHFRYLAGHPTALGIFVNVCGVSQFFADLLARNPEWFELLANPGVRGGARPADLIFRELSNLVDCIVQPELKLEAMRRFRHREMLRIGVRDILGIADMPVTSREFSNLAEACVQKCYAMARERAAERHGSPLPRFAVIALGKLGGFELNYSSDIDLVFVCEPDGSDEDKTLQQANAIAESLVANLSREMQNGHLFRVDMRLRPEGRFGALVRTLASYASYYENWAEVWERQAMLKARPIAGDARLGQAFLAMIAPHAYPRRMTQAMLDAIRENKRRIERGRRSASGPSDVKLDPGGIRDIEFTVQLLQMERGAADPLVRTPNTLQAIARLRQAHALSAADARHLTDAYVFLRDVEHRLQLLYDHQTERLPATERETELLARRLGLADASEFLRLFATHTERVRDVHLRRFWREASPDGPASAQPAAGDGAPRPDSPQGAFGDAEFLDDLTALGNEEADSRLSARLEAEGYREPERAVAILRTALTGTDYGREAPEASSSFLRLAPQLLEVCARVGDPDSALHGLDILSQASPNRAEWYGALTDSPDVLHRLARLASGSRTLVQSLARHPEWLDLLISEEMLEPEPKPIEATEGELQSRLPRDSGDDLELPAFWDELARYAHRERLRIGARDIWGEASVNAIAVELTRLSAAIVQVVLQRCFRAAMRRAGMTDRSSDPCVAVIGLGKFGGQELAYNSDLDVTFVCDDAVFDEEGGSGSLSAGYALVNEVAEAVLSCAKLLRTRGVPFVIDARLRPGGRFGPLVRSVDQYRRYFAEEADTWERQVLVKARPVAGSPSIGARFMAMAHQAVYGEPLSDDAVTEIRAMKRRIESERLRPDERHTNLKLGYGGLSDIEFTAQLWQMRSGAEVTSVRQTGTVDALEALASHEIIPAPDAMRLARCYNLLSSVRNRLALLTGQPLDVFPMDARRARALAIELGHADSRNVRAEDALRSRLSRRMEETRRITDRLFYGAHGFHSQEERA
ncbi:MAG: hypothetical protein GX446_10145 [Chthonomonadales bacterium]|nr:hypothetical protein [Chthonomonadales bacterium]